MRLSDNALMRTPGWVLIVAAVLACAPLSPSKPPRPDSADARTGTSSNATLERDVSQQSYARIEELIQARAPGVQVIRLTSGNFALRIRGLSSPGGNNSPLIVIDGSPTQEGAGNGALAALNPQDVVRIEVLKDAASTAFYGMRGQNGVIVITTRKQ